jgi:hypothetical protein
VELYLHSFNTPSWRGAELKHRVKLLKKGYRYCHVPHRIRLFAGRERFTRVYPLTSLLSHSLLVNKTGVQSYNDTAGSRGLIFRHSISAGSYLGNKVICAC